ncbi:MAG: hypothetical protein VB131_01565 [Burkholderia gladioli]
MMNLPVPFTPGGAPTWKRLIEQADADNQKRNADIVVQKNRLILVDEKGGRWSIAVDSSGQLTARKL